MINFIKLNMHLKSEFYERTSFVPLEYHYRTSIQKTSRKQRADAYLWSTTIVPLFFIVTLTRSLRKLQRYVLHLCAELHILR